MTRIALASAVEEAAARDPVLSNLVSLVGVIKHRPRSADGPFAALARAIVFQQLAGRAAQAILGRVIDAASGHLTAETLSLTSDEALRSAGLSANKLASLRDLTDKVLNGTIDFARLAASVRRRDRRPAHQRARHRQLDSGDVPDVRTSQIGRVAGRRPRRPAGLRAGLGHRSAADCRRRCSPSANGFARTAPFSPAIAGRPLRSTAAEPTQACDRSGQLETAAHEPPQSRLGISFVGCGRSVARRR